MSFATNLKSTALNLLSNYGQSLTFSRTVEGNYNPSTSDVGSGTTTTYSGYGHPSPYTASEIATGLVNVNDIKLIFYSASTLPLVGDTVTIDSDNYRIMNVERMNAQGMDIAYRLQLRV